MNAGEMGKYVDDLVCMIQEAERLEISDSMRHTVELCSALFDVLSNADSAWVPAAAREQAGMLFTIVRKAVGKAEAALVERGAWVGPTSMPMPADASAELPMAPTTGAPPPKGGAPPPHGGAPPHLSRELLEQKSHAQLVELVISLQSQLPAQHAEAAVSRSDVARALKAELATRLQGVVGGVMRRLDESDSDGQADETAPDETAQADLRADLTGKVSRIALEGGLSRGGVGPSPPEGAPSCPLGTSGSACSSSIPPTGAAPCSGAFAEAASSIAALMAGAGVAGTGIAGELAERVTSNFVSTPGGGAAPGGAAPGGVAPGGAAAPAAPAVPAVGSVVMIRGLSTRPELNRSECKVMALLKSGRVGVELVGSGERLSIGRENLQS